MSAVAIDFLLDAFARHSGRTAVVWEGAEHSYAALLDRVVHWRHRLAAEETSPGSVVALESDFSPNAVALLLALVERRALLVPRNRASVEDRSVPYAVAQVEAAWVGEGDDSFRLERFARTAAHPYYDRLRDEAAPGLVLFTSGSTGAPKAAVHHLGRLLEKFREPRRSLRTLNFLLFDHWGGLNTMFHTLASGGAVVTVADRTPDGVCRLVERHRIQLLPASPTFLNLLLLSDAPRRHDLSSLELITYGTEPMPESTLKRLHARFPGVRLQQTYGLIELGVLRSRSRGDDSLWVQVGGDGYQTRVVDGMLQVKAESAMLGYLNAPSPFTGDGWFVTGDRVETDGEWIRILGRDSEIINVGGEKVYPAEVESVIQELPGVAEVTVYRERHPLVGQIVCARVTPRGPEDAAGLAARVKELCRARLQPYKVPVKVVVADAAPVSERFKKVRPLSEPA